MRRLQPPPRRRRRAAPGSRTMVCPAQLSGPTQPPLASRVVKAGEFAAADCEAWITAATPLFREAIRRKAAATRDAS